VRVTRALASGVRVVLRLPELPELPGRLLDGGEEVRIRFGWELEAAPAALVEWVDRRAVAA
jgi:hypothetical protein